MNAKISAIIFVSLFLLIGFSGCEEFDKPDYINVVINYKAEVVLFPKMETIDDPQSLPGKYIQVKYRAN